MYNISFDKKSVALILNDFHEFCNTRVAFCNDEEKEYLAVPEKVCDFCGLIRSDLSFHSKCKICDKNAFNTVRKTEKALAYQCHMGLTEAIVPIMLDLKLVGFMMLGQFLKEKPSDEGWEKMKPLFQTCSIDLEQLREAYFKLPYLDHRQCDASIRILNNNAQYILLSKLVKVSQPAMVDKIKKSIEADKGSNMNIQTLSRSLNISPSYLSHIIKSEFEMPLTKYMNECKMQKAVKLLEETTLSISQIAEKLQYNDVNYFARVFKKNVGCTASEYRNKKQY